MSFTAHVNEMRLKRAFALLVGPHDAARRISDVRKLIEGAGGKLVSFYFTTRDTDFMVISEANEGESIIAAMLAAVVVGHNF